MQIQNLMKCGYEQNKCNVKEHNIKSAYNNIKSALNQHARELVLKKSHKHNKKDLSCLW